MKLLLSHSGDVMCKDKRGYTPLHVAAAGGHLDVVKYLLRLGVEVKSTVVGIHCFSHNISSEEPNTKKVSFSLTFCCDLLPLWR